MEHSLDEVVSRDLPKLVHVLEELKEKIPVVTSHVNSISEYVQRSEFSTESGISLLEMKCHVMLSSLVNFTQLMLMKTAGQSISSSGPVLRLVENRTVLEKIRPLDQKLRYQIDKLVRAATTSLAGPANAPLLFKPNPAQMVSKIEEDGEDDGESDVDGGGEGHKPKLYVPPKVMAVPYEEEEGGKKLLKREERRKKKVARSSIVQDLRNEYLDLPEEVQSVGAGLRSQKDILEEKEREAYEEANFMRLPRKRRASVSGQGTREALDELVGLGDLSSPSGRGGPARKKRKLNRGSGRRASSRRGSRVKGHRRH